MDSNLPATRAETATADAPEGAPLERRRPISVAFLPLALVTFILLAIIITTWTFLAAGT